MFEIKNVSKQYNGEFALNSVSLTIGKGLNFIIGASGSGKTTLLKILSGMEQDFDGEVSYCGKSIKDLSDSEKSYFYNHIFGFVWQDFNLLEDCTVLENVLLPGYLQGGNRIKSAEKVLNDLKISDLAQQKVKYLSGGQKQRVAIARELMKAPQVIIADEPTSALDEKTAKKIIDILRTLSKSRTVIIVTHDTSLIMGKDSVYELDKGELISAPDVDTGKGKALQTGAQHNLSIKSALSLTLMHVKRKLGRSAVAVLSVLLASVLILTAVSGTITDSSKAEFEKLYKTYGDGLTDIGLYSSFIDAAGADGQESKKPDGAVNQDISGLYERYAKDDRVAFIAYLQPFNNICVSFGEKNYPIKNSGNTPTINKLVAGKMPMGDGNEVVIPESLVKAMGISPEKALGKEIDFSGFITIWMGNQPTYKETSAKATIVGVMDTTVSYDYAGQLVQYAVEDSFLFSSAALHEMMEKAGENFGSINFLLRAKTPADMIAIKDELNRQGIVPIGRFELVEDMVRLNQQTAEQSGSAAAVIGALALVMVVAIYLLTGVMRKKEYAIYRISGYGTAHLMKINLTDTLAYAVTAAAVLFAASPLLNGATKAIFHVDILNGKMLFSGAGIIFLLSALTFFITVVTFLKVDVSKALKTGDR